jgi:hypothetical protein
VSELFFFDEGVIVEPPPEPPPPAGVEARVTDWRIDLCDANGVTLDWLDNIATGRAFSYKLNLPSSFTFSVPSSHPKVADLHTDEKPKLCEGRLVRAYRMENDVAVLRFAGKVWTVQDVGDDGKEQTTVVCFDALRQTASRLVRVESGWGSPESATNKVEFDDIDGSYIARWIVAVTNQEKGHTGLEPGFKTFRQTAIDLGVSHYWRLNEGSAPAHDIVGGLDLSGGANPVGILGALVGDRDTTHKNLNLDAVGSATSGDTFTIAGFLNPDNFNIEGTVYWGYGASGIHAPIIRTGTDGKLRLYRANETDDLICTSTTALTTGSWHFFVVTKAGATVKIYIDGVDRTGTVTNATMISGIHVGIGGNQGARMSGGYDEFMTWAGTAITAANVTTLYNASQGVPLATYGNVFELSGTPRSVVYERRRVDSAVTELATSYGGFDLDIVPLERTDGRYGRMDILQQKGTEKPNAIFGYRVFPHNIRHIERGLNLDQLANDIYGTGTPLLGGSALVTHVTDSASIAEFGVFEEVDVFPDINDQGLLDDLLADELGFRLKARELWQWAPTPNASGPRFFDSYDIGDTVTLRCGPELRGGATGLQRVYGVDGVIDDTGVEIVNTITTMPEG